MFDYHAAMKAGHRYNEIVAMRLRDHGIDCTVPELTLVSSKEEIAHMTANDKDIIVGEHVLEVKSRNLAFTDDPMSFPYDDMIVDTVSGYNQKKTKPIGYIMISQKTGGMFVIPDYTYINWTQAVRFDRERKHEDNFYFVGKQYGKQFVALVNYLKKAS
jgi:hypothetical protein